MIMSESFVQKTCVYALMLLHIPVTFWACFRTGGPPAFTTFVYVGVAGGEEVVHDIVVPIAPMCFPASVLFSYVVSTYKTFVDETSSADAWGSFDDGPVFADRAWLFWVACFTFVAVRFMCLVVTMDLFAFFLILFMWYTSLYLSCRKVPTSSLLYVRFLAVGMFFASNVLLCVAMFIGESSNVNGYLLGCCVIVDMVLIMGHTWDYPECTNRTVHVCRFCYLLAIVVLVPLCIAGNRGYI